MRSVRPGVSWRASSPRADGDATAALAPATRAVELESKAAHAWNTLGTAQYRSGNWHAAIESLEKSEQLSPGEYFGDNAFFLGMAHWQLDEKEDARKWYEQAVEWMEKKKPNDDGLKRFRAEAAELLGVEKKLPADETPQAEPVAKEQK